MIEIRVLGPVAIEVDGGPAPRQLTWRKNLALLVYLARSPRRRRSREHLAGLLWANKGEEAARHSLNEALRTLRSHGGESLIASEGRQVVCSADGVVLDVDRLERALSEEAWEAAATEVGGPFLEGFGVPDASAFEDWMSSERRTWSDRSVRALAGCVEERLAVGRLSAAREAADRIRALDPLSGVGARALMTVKALEGERAGALEIFERWRSLLAEELGVEPDPASQRLADRIRRERYWSPPVGGAAEPTARPAPLVGRERELAAVTRVLREAGERSTGAVVAVEGDPGTGKSRLLEEAARRARLAGAVTPSVRAVPADRDEPHGTLLALCRDDLLEAPGLVAAPPGALAAVAGRLPAWRERFAEEIGDADPVGLDLALSGLLGAVLEEQPVVIVVDDAGHLDPATAGALEAALRDHADRPLALLLARGTSPAGEPLDRLVGRVGRDLGGGAVRLGPLGPEALRELAAALLADYGPAELDRLARRLAADSGGYPALAVRIVEAVRDGLELGDGAEAWPVPDRTLDQTLPGELPGTVTAAVRVGFRTLSPVAQRVLAAASVHGERVEAEGLVHATGLGRRDVEAALDELEWRRWLASEPRGYGFVARIVGDVIARDMLTEGQRRRYREGFTGA